METDELVVGDWVIHRSLPGKGTGQVIDVAGGQPYTMQQAKIKFESCTGWFFSEELIKQEQPA